jgi:pimeloyl-ACP methyl ester carboxylesterase
MATSLPPGQTVILNEMQMYYVLAGEGEPRILLHGFTGASDDLAILFDDLLGKYQLVIPDLRGHGRSTNPSEEFTFRQCAHDMFALLDFLGIERFKAIGWSGGGNTLLHMATQ